MYEQFPEVMNMLWARMLRDNKKNWRRVYKVCHCTVLLQHHTHTLNKNHFIITHSVLSKVLIDQMKLNCVFNNSQLAMNRNS